MRIVTVVALATAVSLLATSARAELQLMNNGTLNADEARAKFDAAWRACSAEVPAGSSQAVLYACINKKIERFKLKAVNS